MQLTTIHLQHWNDSDPFHLGMAAGKIRGKRVAIGYDRPKMIALVEQRKDELAALCRQFNVERLDLFGSAADGSFQDFTFVRRPKRAVT